ncbi:MAG TPA: hypothetical protein PLB97_06765 [Accumulibacter sp.]|nr:hypothetical protein [Accumulibacter sp.]
MIDVDQLFIGKQAGFSDARPAERRSGDFRDLPERWRPSEAERNQAAFMVCRWLNHSEDTEADRREGFEWALAKRCAFDWLRRHLGNGNAFAIDDNRRPCACCAQRTAAPDSRRAMTSWASFKPVCRFSGVFFPGLPKCGTAALPTASAFDQTEITRLTDARECLPPCLPHGRFGIYCAM